VPIALTAREVAKAVPGAKLNEYEDAAHGLFASHKDRLIGDLLAFFEETSTA
jgi:pimeloyl-ACP methyl ester carboxylesterase